MSAGSVPRSSSLGSPAKRPVVTGLVVSGLVLLLRAGGTLANAGAATLTASPIERAVREFAPEVGEKLDLPGFYSGLETARALMFAGRYRAALAELYRLDEAKNADVEIAVVRGEALLHIGDQVATRKALEPHTDDPRAAVLLARLDLRVGRYRQAQDRMTPLVENQNTDPEFAWWLGQSLEKQGDTVGAISVYHQIAKGPTIATWQRCGAAGFESASELTFAAKCVDRWATLTFAYKDQPALHNTVYDMLVGAYDVVDRSYWPARLAAAQYAAQRDDEQGAIKELQQVLESNPGSVEALVSLGEIAIRLFQFELAEQAIQGLRAVEHDSFEADVLHARNLLRQRQPLAAKEVLARAQAKRPNDAQVVGLLASLDMLELRQEQALERLEEFDKNYPDDARPYFEVAEQLGSLRQYQQGCMFYEKAIERAPWWTAARNGLGLMLTQAGDDDAARQVLEAARKLDPFNRKTTNYLRLLDDVAKYQRFESDHFVIVLDQQADPIIAQFILEYLEPVHNELVEKYRWSPARKTVIEVFPTHDRFSVRTTGNPFIGTVGAATGPIIAMVSPRDGPQTLGLYNWADVLRHEYTHTITLGKTNNRIAHWMTEGLAVIEEARPIRWDWVPMLYNATSKGELFDLNELTWAFVRPKKPTDRSMAYAQSGWLCRYLIDKYGKETILKILEDFRDGKTQDEAFSARTGRSLDELFLDFEAWAKSEIAKWGYDDVSTLKYKVLVAQAEQAIGNKDFPVAAATWEQIAVLRPMDRLPHQRLAGIYLQPTMNDPKRALLHLAELSRGEAKDNRIAKRAARIARDQLKDLEQAVYFATNAIHLNPYDVDAQRLAAEVFEAKGDAARANRHHKAIELIAGMAADDSDPR